MLPEIRCPAIQCVRPSAALSHPCFRSRGRSPQPPAEDDEEDFDDTLVAIDTCECPEKRRGGGKRNPPLPGWGA